MRYVVNRMTVSDIPRVVEIERLAYASPWPSSTYRGEIQDNRHAHYIVVRDTAIAPQARVVERAEALRRPFPLSLLTPRPQPAATGAELSSIVGFAGLWLMIDEGHVTTIAVHPDARGHGVGELMLHALINISYEIGARMVTLEVRVSNSIAQNLYRKYGFREAGIRRRYYSDNQEDALIMWTEEIESPAYREQFAQLTAALTQRMQAQGNRTSVDRRSNAVGES